MDFPFNEDCAEDTHVDLTPLIDVVFLLLVFFILAATFVQPGLEVDLPAAKSSQQPSANKQWLIISIDADGCYHFKGEKQTMPSIVEILKDNPDRAINFHVDKNAPFDSFVRIVDQVKLEGRDEFIVTTKASEDDA
jgi:biopolymer transport protein ExbD